VRDRIWLRLKVAPTMGVEAWTGRAVRSFGTLWV